MGIKALVEDLLKEVQQLRSELQELREGGIVKKKKVISSKSLTISEAAIALNVSNSTIRNWIGQGLLISYKEKGSATKIPLESINQL